MENKRNVISIPIDGSIIEFLGPENINFRIKLETDTILKNKYKTDFSVISYGIITCKDREDRGIRHIFFNVDNSSNLVNLVSYFEVNDEYKEEPSITIEFNNVGVSRWYRHNRIDHRCTEEDYIAGQVMGGFLSYFGKLTHILNTNFKVQEHLIEKDRHILTISKNRVKYRLSLNAKTYKKFINKYM
ncbi:hypothetical protein [Clostridium saccharoperbutylacetonicum]|uniref:hypothetical protein n=1 Tax=Clostridium saccharoperbutylacetonicum TaxID=36745 RepID=UPI0039EC5511